MRIAVIFGGSSEERDVSIASGLEVISGLRSLGHEVLAVDTALGALTAEQELALSGYAVASRPPDSQQLVAARKVSPVAVAAVAELREVDVVFIALHGGSGEDGTLQAMLAASGIPFTGSGHVGSAIAMDKNVAKRLMVAVKVPTPAWQMCTGAGPDTRNNLGWPVVVKPNAQGSTIGLSLVHEAARLPDAIEQAARFDDEVMLEAYVAGREFTVGILDGQPLAVGEIIAGSDIFDYASKYQVDGAEEVFPAQIPSSTTKAIQELGVRVHTVLKLGGYSRVDFRMDATGGLWCLEANSVPGLTPTSLLPQSAAAAGIGFAELCQRICELALTGNKSR